jgi:hypothetical protein
VEILPYNHKKEELVMVVLQIYREVQELETLVVVVVQVATVVLARVVVLVVQES